MSDLEKQNEGKKDSFIDSFINFLFSDNITKWLIPILLVGIILRFIVTRNISALGDEMVHGPHAIGFLHSGLISTFAHSPLWFYLTDLVFKILGVTLFSTRFLSFFYGILTIILVYFISTKIFNKKVGLISAFLLSVSYYTIRYTLMEMDLSALFFLCLAIYLFINSLENKKFPYLAAISIGIASLIKTLSLFFVPAFLIAFFIFRKDANKKTNAKHLIYFGLLVTLIFSPIIIHNYLWYHDSKMVDTYVAQYFDIGNARQAYTGLLGYDSGFLYQKFFNGLVTMSKVIFTLDPIISIIGLLGIIMSFSLIEKRKYWWLLILFEISGLIFLLLSNWLPTHYTTMIPILAIFGGFFLDKISHDLIKFFNYKKTLSILLIVILVFQIYMLIPHLTSQAAMGQMRSYATAEMDKNSIVMVDSRIYRGRIAWLFNDFHYIESGAFPQIMEINKQLPGNDQPFDLYFIECARDDCGWGTVRNDSLNESSEYFVKMFESQSKLDKTILGGGGYDEITGQPYFNVYKASIALKPSIIREIDSTHEWFYYPVNYLPKEKIFDRYALYKVSDPFYIQMFNILLYYLAVAIIWISIILAIVLPPLLFFKFLKQK